MLSESHKALFRTHGTMVGRMLLGLLFVYSGIGILMNGIGATAGYFTSVGVPMAGFVIFIVLAIKILGGASLMLGYKTEEAALLLILFTLGATWYGHLNPVDSISVLKNLAIIGGLLYTIAYGPGQGWKMQQKMM